MKRVWGLFGGSGGDKKKKDGGSDVPNHLGIDYQASSNRSSMPDFLGDWALAVDTLGSEGASSSSAAAPIATASRQQAAPEKPKRTASLSRKATLGRSFSKKAPPSAAANPAQQKVAEVASAPGKKGGHRRGLSITSNHSSAAAAAASAASSTSANDKSDSGDKGNWSLDGNGKWTRGGTLVKGKAKAANGTKAPPEPSKAAKVPSEPVKKPSKSALKSSLASSKSKKETVHSLTSSSSSTASRSNIKVSFMDPPTLQREDPQAQSAASSSIFSFFRANAPASDKEPKGTNPLESAKNKEEKKKNKEEKKKKKKEKKEERKTADLPKNVARDCLHYIPIRSGVLTMLLLTVLFELVVVVIMLTMLIVEKRIRLDALPSIFPGSMTASSTPTDPPSVVDRPDAFKAFTVGQGAGLFTYAILMLLNAIVGLVSAIKRFCLPFVGFVGVNAVLVAVQVGLTVVLPSLMAIVLVIVAIFMAFTYWQYSRTMAVELAELARASPA